MPTTESWERYWEDKKAWDEKMEKEKPNPDAYNDLESYAKAFNAWMMKWACDAPNKPGYFRANND